MSFLDIASAYFTSQPVLATAGLLLSSLGPLFVLFKLERSRPHRRVRILFASFAVVISTWSFVALSFLLCGALEGLYDAGAEVAAITTVFSLALLASLSIALPLSALVTYKVPGLISKRLLMELPEPHGAFVDAASRMARGLRIPEVKILQSPSGVPFAYSVGGAENVIVVSEGITARLNEDELETVLAHELAHVKSHDSGLNMIIAVYRRVLFFDPFIRLLERAMYSEKEFSADEFSARETQKPLSLASALLKISSGQSGMGSSAKIEGISILGSRKLPKPPGVRERIERLMRLATELEGPDVLRSDAMKSS